MGRFRGVVLPVLRLLVWVVIAVALCFIAFGNRSKADDALTPDIGSSTSTVPVTKGDIRSVIEVSGTVEADPAVTVKSTSSGKVTRVRAAKDDMVEDGTPLFNVQVELPAAEPKPDAQGNLQPSTPRYTTKVVRATSTGKLTSFDVLVDQEVQVGTEVGKVSPGSLTVVAPLTQAQQFRLLSPPASAQAQAPGGPAPFECANVRTAAAEPTQQQTTPEDGGPFMDGGSGAVSTAEVRCAVPSGATVFAGMSVNLSLDTGSATGVLTLPVTAVQGTVGNGKVWIPNPDGGEPQEKPVKLGLTDGTSVQITDGLSENQEVLEFAPVPDDDAGSGTEDPSMMGGQEYVG